MTGKHDRKPDSDGSLEALLRRLPQPTVPTDLEARLIAAIAANRPSAALRRRPLWPWAVAGLGAAALVIVSLVAVSASRHSRGTSLAPPVTLAMSDADIQRAIQREAISARLMASSQILAMLPGGQGDAAKMLQYVAREYADTSAAKQLFPPASRNQGDIP